MIQKMRNINIIYVLIIMASLFFSWGVSKVYAAPLTPQCLQMVPYGDTTPTNPSPTGNGFIYRTMRIVVNVPSDQFDILGGYIDQTCAVSSAWTLGGQTVYAVQAELGRKLDSHVGGALSTYPFCVPVIPTYGGPTVQGCMAEHQDYPIYQDDAAIVQINDTTISCIGIWPCGNVFENGVSPDGRLADNPVTTTRNVNAHRGAGFVNVPRRTLAGNSTSNINNLSVTMIAANTFSGNFESSVLITLKYRQIQPGACSPNTQTVGINQSATLTASGTGPFSWTATGGSPSSGSSASFTTSYPTAGTRTVRLTTPSGSVNCTVVVTAPIGCPSLPDPYVRVTLHRTYSDGGPARAGYGSHTQRVTRETRYTSHSDISPGGGRVLPPLVSESAGNPGNVVLDYGAYIQEYPFDRNQSRVFYNDAYDQYYYTYSGAEVWDRHDVYRWRYYETSRRPPRGEWRYEYWYTYYTFAGYAPVLQSTTRYNINRSVDALLMQPCWQRHYDVDQVNISQPTLTPDRENPNTSAALGSIGVQFDVDPVARGRGRQDMRIASRVDGVPARISYRILRSNGSTGGGGVVNSANLTITANSANQRARGSATLGGLIQVSIETGNNAMFVGDRVCWTVSVPSRRTGLVTVDGSASNPSGSNSSPETCSMPVANWPYLKVFGNDIVSGGSFTEGCTTASPIRSRFRLGPDGNIQARGTSSQYAVFALGSISGVTSASLRNGAGSAAAGPGGLTFANNTNPPFGGQYAANDGIACMPNYFGSRPDSTVDINNFMPQFNSPNDDPNRIEYYEIDGSYTHNAVGPGIRDGVRKVFYVNGTLNINTDIRYQNESWNDRNNVPFVIIIARDINIAPGVSRLDGVYVAQSFGGGSGTLNTCTTAYDACRNPLVVNGALFANQVNFLRTRGSLRNSVVNEGRNGVFPSSVGANRCSVPWNAPVQAATNTGAAGGNVCASEVISFSPEIYLSLSQILIPEDNFRFDSYVTLPPNL